MRGLARVWRARGRAHSADVGGFSGQWALAVYLRGRRVDRWERGACSAASRGACERGWGARGGGCSAAWGEGAEREVLPLKLECQGSKLWWPFFTECALP